MTELRLLDNDEATLGDALNDACMAATRGRVAVAFAKGSGVDSAPGLAEMNKRGARVDLLAGIDFQLTDLGALARFEHPSETRVYVNPDSSGRRVFHPKLYILDSPEQSTVIIGSSNLTGGGLVGNVEANVLVRGRPDEPLIQSARAFHTRLWESGFALRVTNQFREHYQRLQTRRHQVELALREEADFSSAQRKLKQAVVEAFASYRQPGTRKSWLLITSQENYIRNIRGRIWGDQQKKRIAQVRPGDLIYFYIKGMKQIGAMGVVTRETYEDHSPHWLDGRTYPYRFGFVTLLEPPTPVPFRPLVPHLDVYGRQDHPNWGQYLQTSMLELTAHDSDVIRAALGSVDDAATVA